MLHSPRPGLGTRDLLASIEHDRRARHTREIAATLAAAALVFLAFYLAALGLAGALEFIRHLFHLAK